MKKLLFAGIACLLLAMHPVVEVEVALGPNEHPVDGKATPDAEGDVAVGVRPK